MSIITVLLPHTHFASRLLNYYTFICRFLHFYAGLMSTTGEMTYHLLRGTLLLVTCWHAFRYCAMSKELLQIKGGGKQLTIWLIELSIKL